MGGKIAETRFTIQFSKTDPSHLQVADILNQQGRRSKAQYIVNAVLHYESCGEIPDMQRTVKLDVKAIEAVVNRMLMEWEKNIPGDLPKKTHMLEKPTPQLEEIGFDDALKAIGEDGISAIADTLDLFRKNKP